MRDDLAFGMLMLGITALAALVAVTRGMPWAM
jgi:hypothetical protein